MKKKPPDDQQLFIEKLLRMELKVSRTPTQIIDDLWFLSIYDVHTYVVHTYREPYIIAHCFKL